MSSSNHTSASASNLDTSRSSHCACASCTAYRMCLIFNVKLGKELIAACRSNISNLQLSRQL